MREGFELGDLVLFPFTRTKLVKLRLTALRRGVWFRCMNKIERGLVDLTLRVVSWVRSSVLARSLALVAKKLCSLVESKVVRQVRTIGFPLVQELSRIAQGWGNESAVTWMGDYGFSRFLAICHMN